MATIALTQEGSQQLTKPTDWPSFMVTAALKYALDQSTPCTYPSADDARLAILNTLNWYEAHDGYEWPDFSRLSFDFSQAMRFRRALVNDVFVALKKAGNVRVSEGEGVLGTPESEIKFARATKRGGGGGHRTAERKRHCKREEGSDTEIESTSDEDSLLKDDKFLAQVMRDLIMRSMIDLSAPVGRNRDVDEFVGCLIHQLVKICGGPADCMCRDGCKATGEAECVGEERKVVRCCGTE